MFLYLLGFMGLFVVAAFGPTYLLLRKTPYAPYSILLSFVSFQPLLLVCISLLGYRLPFPLKPLHVFAPVMVGIALTVFVVLRFRREISTMLCDTWETTLLISGLALTSMVLATPLLLSSASLAYIDWWNGELVNYSYLAQAFLGRLDDPNYTPSFEQSVALRYGAELFLACLSVLSGKAPLMLIQVLSALHKAAAIIAFAVSCDLMRWERDLRPEATIAGCVGFAFATILAFNHQLSFLAAQAVTGSFILISLGLLAGGLQARRVQVFLALHLLLIVITYGETLPLLGAIGVLAFIEAVWKRRKGVPVAMVSLFAAGILINPLLVVERLGHMYRLRSVVAGFNVIGVPSDNLEAYLAAVLGLRYPLLDVPPLPHALVLAGIFLGLLAVVGAFLVTAYRLRTLLFLGIPLLLLLMHFKLLPSVQPAGSEFYKSYKTIAALYFFVFFSQVFLLDALFRSRPWRGGAGAAKILLFAGSGLLILGNIFISSRAAIVIKEVPSVYREADVRRALAPVDHGSGPVLFLINDITASFWDLMANYLGAHRQLLDRNQAVIVYHNNSPAIIEPMVFPARAIPGTPAGPEAIFAGKIIISRIGFYSPGPHVVDVRAALQALAPSVWLREDRVVFDTPAFRVINGALMNNGIAGSGADGLQNQPPTIIGVAPNFGKESNAMVNFTYSDPNGESDVVQLLININSGSSTTNGCYMSYNRPANQLGLVLDGNKAWDVSILGSGKNLENSNCVIDLAHCSTSGTGKEFTLHLAVKFKPAFTGRKMIYTTVADTEKLTTGWQSVGWWDVP